MLRSKIAFGISSVAIEPAAAVRGSSAKVQIYFYHQVFYARKTPDAYYGRDANMALSAAYVDNVDHNGRNPYT